MPPSSPIVEVRIPTFNRPMHLRRALDALLNQTYGNWRAVILDDGDAAITRDVVSEVGDGRISHHPNRERLGAASNIMQAFARGPIVEGEFFYVLEDDNVILPKFIEENLGWLSTHDVGLVINNQWVEVPSALPQAGLPEHDDRTTLECFTEGVWSADDFKIALLWRTPFSNGSVFWRRNCRSDFTLDNRCPSSLHEELRALRLDDEIYFNATPNAFWYPGESAADRSISAMSAYLMRERALLAIRRRILSRLHRLGESEKLLSERYNTPLCFREEGVLKACGRWPGPSGLTFQRRAELIAKALLLSMVPDVLLR